MADLPSHARVVVIGGGAAGTSTLYHLALKGWTDALLLEANEMTVARFAEDRFWLIGPAAGEWHDRDWLLQRLPADGSVRLENITGKFGTLVLAGPKAREVLAAVSDCGELGWELHMPMDALPSVYHALMAAGASSGIRDFGMYAMESLRLEKAYRAWKQDLASEYTPLAASLDRFVALDKPAFVGRDALLRERDEGPDEAFVPMVVEDGTADALYGSIVWQNGSRVGVVTSGGYGHRIRKSIALAYVRCHLAVEGTELEIDILGQPRRATVAREPLFDPENERLRA